MTDKESRLNDEHSDAEFGVGFDKESIDHSYEGYLAKLAKLAQESPTFEVFIERVKTFKNWYHGKPMLEEFTRWTLSDYQKFYQENL